MRRRGRGSTPCGCGDGCRRYTHSSLVTQLLFLQELDFRASLHPGVHEINERGQPPPGLFVGGGVGPRGADLAGGTVHPYVEMRRRVEDPTTRQQSRGCRERG